MAKVLKFILSKDQTKNRHRLEIVRDMLIVVRAKSKKTRIMYQANLNYQLMEKYLRRLLKSGLMECADNYYLITSRGRQFLELYNNYLERCKRVRDDISDLREDKSSLEDMCFNSSGSNMKRVHV